MPPLDSPPPFPGFRETAFEFLRALAENNEREWFKARKDTYEEAVKAPLELLLLDGARRLKRAGLPLTARPKQSRFRIHRDLRFTDDKTPYKTNVGGVFDRSGEKETNGVVYVHVEPGHCFLAAGFYKPSVSYLRPVRRRIAAQPERFHAMLDAMSDNGVPVNSMDDTLTGMPRGFSDHRDEEVASYLKWKNYVTRRFFPDEALRSPAFTEEVVRMARDAEPLLTFVWEAESSAS
jgi:uncharacterized protein (TIGR02453 family)